MDSTYLTPVSKSILTGLFAGIIATLLCLGYNIFYRDSTGYPLASIINVSSLIFFVNFVFVVIGFIYYGFIKAMKKGDIAFAVVFILLTIYFSWQATMTHRSDNPVFNTEFHHLLIAMIIIMGVFAAIGIPVLFNSKKFEEHVL